MARVPTCGGDFRLADTEVGELAITHALLRRASEGHLHQAVRLYSPIAPVVVFGRRDARLPGFGAAAVRAAERAGFATAVRAVGGRVVAYTQSSVVLEVVQHEPHAVQDLDRRFTAHGAVMATALRGLGIDARVGPVPGEYCPGAHSVNARGVVKLVGSAQRVVKNAWLLSSLMIVDDERRLREVLAEVHAHLGLALEASSVGSVRGENQAATLGAAHAAVEQAWGLGEATPGGPDAATMGLAVDLEPSHRTREATNTRPGGLGAQPLGGRPRRPGGSVGAQGLDAWATVP